MDFKNNLCFLVLIFLGLLEEVKNLVGIAVVGRGKSDFVIEVGNGEGVGIVGGIFYYLYFFCLFQYLFFQLKTVPLLVTRE